MYRTSSPAGPPNFFFFCSNTRTDQVSFCDHHPVTPTIVFLSINFLSLSADSKSNKYLGHRGFCMFFNQVILWRKSCAKDKKKLSWNVATKVTSFDSQIRQQTYRDSLSDNEVNIIITGSCKEQGRPCHH